MIFRGTPLKVLQRVLHGVGLRVLSSPPGKSLPLYFRVFATCLTFTIWPIYPLTLSEERCSRTRVHLSSDKSSHIFKHLLSSERCRQSCSADCFEILDSAPTKFQLKLKEAMHIDWEKPNLNQQVHHVNLTLTL